MLRGDAEPSLPRSSTSPIRLQRTFFASRSASHTDSERMPSVWDSTGALGLAELRSREGERTDAREMDGQAVGLRLCGNPAAVRVSWARLFDLSTRTQNAQVAGIYFGRCILPRAGSPVFEEGPGQEPDPARPIRSPARTAGGHRPCLPGGGTPVTDLRTRRERLPHRTAASGPATTAASPPASAPRRRPSRRSTPWS